MTPGLIIDTMADDHVLIRQELLTGYARPIRATHRLLLCPICGRGQPEPPHGAPKSCPGCGSKFLRHGQRLQITVGPGPAERDDIKIEGNVAGPVGRFAVPEAGIRLTNEGPTEEAS